MLCDEAVISGDVAPVASLTEETKHVLIARQRSEGSKLEPVQCDVCGIEVHHIDARWRPRQIGKHIAAAGADRHHPVTLTKLHSVHVDLRVFPYLRIDQTREEKGEQPLGKPFA